MRRIKVLITGPKGYLAQALIKNTDIDFVFEKNTYNDIIETDITNVERFYDMEFDVILHNAGIVGTTNCDASTYTLDVNVNGTVNMINLALRKNVPLIFFSTTVVYEPTNEYISEDSKKNPHTLYGKTKLIGEYLIKSLMKDFIIIRPCMIFGLNDKHSAITMAMTSTKENKKAIHLNPEYEKPYLHVDEFARGMNIVINNYKKLLGEDINFAPAVHLQVKDILMFIDNLTGTHDYILHKKNDYLRNHVLSGHKIHKLLKWRQKTNIYVEIERMYCELKNKGNR